MEQRTPLKNPRTPKNPVALILIDWFSDWRMSNGSRLCRQAKDAVEAASRLVTGARRHEVPVIYVNDNRGQWRSDFQAVIRDRVASPAAAITDCLAPASDDYFVLKPKHSAFLATPLALLLQHLNTQVVVLAGVAGNQCVLATALDAYMRDLQVIVASDASASITAKAHRQAMEVCRDFGCSVRSTAAIRWPALKRMPRDR